MPLKLWLLLYDLLEEIRLFIPLFVRRKTFSKQDILVQMSSAQIPPDGVHLWFRPTFPRELTSFVWSSSGVSAVGTLPPVPGPPICSTRLSPAPASPSWLSLGWFCEQSGWLLCSRRPAVGFWRNNVAAQVFLRSKPLQRRLPKTVLKLKKAKYFSCVCNFKTIDFNNLNEKDNIIYFIFDWQLLPQKQNLLLLTEGWVHL